MGRKIYLLFSFLCVTSLGIAQDNFWRGTKSSDWTNPQNWSLNHVPQASDTVQIVSANTVLVLPENLQIAGLFLKASTLDLGGKQLTITTKTLVQEGTVKNGKMNCKGTIVSLGVVNAPLRIEAKLNIHIKDFTIRNTTFTDSLFVIKDGSTNQASAGGNKYYGFCHFENKGKGNLSLANQLPDSVFNQMILVSKHDSSFINFSQNAIGSYFAAPLSLIIHGGGVKFAQSNGSILFDKDAYLTTIDSTNFKNGKLYFKNITYLPTALTTIYGDSNAQVYFQKYNYWNGSISVKCGSVVADSNYFDKSVSLTKTGSRNDVMLGGNTFNGSFEVTNFGNGFWMTNTKYSSTYNGSALFSSQSNGIVYLANNVEGTQFKGRVEFKCNNGGKGIRIAQSGGGAIFTSSASLVVTDFNSGDLEIKNAQILCNIPVQLSLQDSGKLNINGSCIFSSTLFVNAASIKIFKSVFNKEVSITKNSEINTVSNGGNYFYDKLNIDVRGGGYLTMGNVLPDTFMKEVSVIAGQGSRAYFGNSSKGNYFNENIIVSFTDSSGLYFGTSGGENILNKFILENPTLPCSGGLLQMKNVKQLNPGKFNLVLSDSAKFLIQKGSEFFGRIQIEGPSLNVDSSVFHKSFQFNKRGDYNDLSNGGNIFEDSLIINNFSNRTITLANKYPDTIAHLILATYKKGSINFVQSSKGSFVQQTLSLKSNRGAGILFCQGGGTLGLGNLCVVKVDTFNSGRLVFRGVHFSSLSHEIEIRAKDSASVYFQKECVLNTAFDIESPNILLDSVAFLNNVTLSKTGAGSNVWTGKNVFHKVLNLSIYNGGTVITGNKYPDQFLGDINISIHNKSQLMLANTADSNMFSTAVSVALFDSSILSVGFNGGKVLFNSQGDFIINEKSGNGIFRFKNTIFANAISLNSFNNSVLSFNKCLFYKTLEINASSINISETECFDQVRLTKSGLLTDVWEGGNIFHENTFFTNTTAGSWILTNTKANYFNKNIFIANMDTGKLTVTYKVPTYLKGNIDVNTDKDVFFGVGGAELNLIGDEDQILYCADKKLSIENLIIQKNTGEVLFIDTLELGKTIQFKKGKLRVLPADVLYFKQNAQVYFPSENSYVIGRVYKIGQGDFVFPIGLDHLYRPIAISSPKFSSDTIGINFVDASPVGLAPYNKTDFKIESILDCGYWQYVSNSQGSLKFSSYFNEIKCKVPNLLAYTFVEHTSDGWNYLGGLNQSYLNDSLVYIESAYLNSKSNAIAIGMGHYNIPFVYALNEFTADYNKVQQVNLTWETQAEPGNKFYIVERSISGFNFLPIGKVMGTANVDKPSRYYFTDSLSYIGIRYYRLKQFFEDSTYTVSPLLALKIYPPEQIRVSPNPLIGNTLQIALPNAVFGTTKIELISPMGNVVYQDRMFFDSSTLLFSYDLKFRPRQGFYFLRISDVGSSETQRIYIP